MSIAKNYSAFVPAGNFNIIASDTSNVSFVTLDGQEGRFVAVAACEHVVIWDMKRGEKALVLNGEKSAVTAICANPDKRHLAVGYSDGVVHIFDLKTGEMLNQYQGHDSAVKCLAFDQNGFNFASGSLDTDVVVWDLVEEKGLCRLSGHTKPITKVLFMSKLPILITSSRDTHVKLWDYEIKHCFKTIVGIHSEVWSMALMREEKYLVVAGSEEVLTIWKLVNTDEDNANDVKVENDKENHEDDDLKYPVKCYKFGTISKGTNVTGSVSLTADASGQILACHGRQKCISILQFVSEEEANEKLEKRIKMIRRKNRTENGEAKIELSDKILSLTTHDLVKRLNTVELSGRPKSVDIVLGRGNEARLAVSLKDNELQLHTLNCDNVEAKCLKTISHLQGHQGEVKTLAFSSDNQTIISGSRESIKSWSRVTQAMTNTVATTSPTTCLIFAPGDRYVLAGSKKGELLIIDIASADLKEVISAHDDEIRSICLTADKRGIITGGLDNTVKFWQFELIQDKTNSESIAKVLSVIHTRTLKLEDAVWCVKVTPNEKFIAVALSDSTVKIFFIDSFKLFLVLYGHSQPVSVMDIASDSSIIATGGSDRNIKIWALDYGNCLRSIFAHDDSITGVQFIPGTHSLFSCGKDGSLKHWVGKQFQKLETLHGHIGQAYGMAVSPNGDFVISCGSDRVLRLYMGDDTSGENLLSLKDQEELEREQQEPLATGKVTLVPGIGEVKLPSKKTLKSEEGADKILEMLRVCEDYQTALDAAQDGENVKIPMEMVAYQVDSIDDFMIKILGLIRSTDLEQALLLIPFNAACILMKRIPDLIEKGYDPYLLTNVFTFLLTIYHPVIVQTSDLYETIEKYYNISMNRLRELKDLYGCNLYGIKHILRKQETKSSDVEVERKKKIKKKKNAEKRNYMRMMLNN